MISSLYLTSLTVVFYRPFVLPNQDQVDDYTIFHNWPSSSSVPSAEDVLTDMASLFLDYRQSLSKITTLPDPQSKIPPDSEGGEADVMSKNQQQLTVDEGHIWEDILSSPTTTESTQSSLESLFRKSDLMAASYRRRAVPATAQTFNESKEILQAMGVPCLAPEGPFEAEALASALVHNGLADYVASEDTVRPAWSTLIQVLSWTLS